MNLKIDDQKLTELVVQEAAEHLLHGDENLHDLVATVVANRVEKYIEKHVEKIIQETLEKEFAELLNKEYDICNVWGEKTGQVTTLKDRLHERAIGFWDQRVEKRNGKWVPTTYGGTPRHEVMMKEALELAFASALKENMTEVVKAFKATVKKDLMATVTKNLDDLFRVK